MGMVAMDIWIDLAEVYNQSYQAMPKELAWMAMFVVHSHVDQFTPVSAKVKQNCSCILYYNYFHSK